MLQSLKQKTLKSNLWVILALAAVLIGGLVYFGGDYLLLLRGPQYFEPLADHEIDELNGAYVEADVDTLIDYYAETVSSESGRADRVTSREYLMPVNTADQTIYIGLQVPASLISDADAVVADTGSYLADTDGSYEWDGSYVSVKGTIRPMDEETLALYEDYLGDYSDELGTTFLPLVLVHDEIGSATMETLVIAGIAGLVLLAILLFILINSLNGGYQKQIKNYIAASEDPQGTEQALDRMYEDTQNDGNVRMSRNWLMYIHGMDSWVLAGDDIAWAYQHTLRRKMYGVVTVGKTVSVKVCGVKENKKSREHSIPVANEEAAQELLAELQRMYPNAAYGYTPEVERRYNTDPAGLQADVRRAHAQAAAPAADTPADAQPAAEV